MEKKFTSGATAGFIFKITIGVVILIAMSVLTFIFVNSKRHEEPSDVEQISNNIREEDEVGRKVLVTYYSAQGHTKAVAEKIAQNLGADTFEITPQTIYTAEDLDWTDTNSRVGREHDDEELRDVALVKVTPENWNEYMTVLIGYPIWWGIAAWPVNSFVKDNDFNNKTVIPFATSVSSGLGQSGELLKNMTHSGEWQTGKRFSSDVSDAEIKSWTDSLHEM